MHVSRKDERAAKSLVRRRIEAWAHDPQGMKHNWLVLFSSPAVTHNLVSPQMTFSIDLHSI
jgi:hypothetical protein